MKHELNPDAASGGASQPVARRYAAKRPWTRLLGGMLGCALVSVALAACSSSPDSEGSCAVAFVREGTTFYPYATEQRVPGGRSIGTVDRAPCADGEEGDDPEPASAMTVEGISPDIAFVVPSEGARTLFVKGPPDGSRLPPEVRALVKDRE